MNLVGKIFTVLIFLMCIVFATFALMVHAAHKNWKAVVMAPGGMNDQLTEANKQQKQLEEEKATLQNKLEDERKGIQRRLIALSDAAKTAITKQNEDNAKLLAEEAKVRGLAAAIDSTTKRLNVLQTTIDGMRQEIVAAVNQRNMTEKQFIDTNDKLLNAVAERQRVQKLMGELVKQLTDARTALGILKADANVLAKSPPTDLEGEVTAVVGGDVEISVGADDGVRKGFQFVVTRPSTGKYIGKIVVIRVDYPNRAVCLPVKESLNDQIQRGDHVKADTGPANSGSRPGAPRRAG